MMWKVFERYFDIELFHQMVEMIYQLSKEKNKEKIIQGIWDHALFMNKQLKPKTIEEVYELKYPGEVLERLKDKTELTVEKIRSLSLALVFTKELQDERMFIGTQFITFLKWIHTLAKEEEIFLLGTGYLLDANKKDILYEQILKFPYENVEEIIFILSILPDDERIWDALKIRLNQYLGEKRSLDIFENTGIFTWIARNCGNRMKGYRKNDLDIIKCITRLPFVYAHDKNNINIKFQKVGYSESEIIYLNLMLAKQVSLPGALGEHIIAMEKMAVNACLFYLSSEEQYPETVYQLCAELFADFRKFNVKLSGYKGIVERLNPILKIQNIKSYQFLYQFKDWVGVNWEWFYIDLTDQKWFPLYEWLDEREYEIRVDDTLQWKKYQEGEVLQYLKNYRELTGSDYQNIFWKPYSSHRTGIFTMLSRIGVVKPVELMRDYIHDLKGKPDSNDDKWKSISLYLREYLDGMKTPESYQMLKVIDEALGVASMDKIFHTTNFILNCFGIRDHRNYFAKLDFMRNFLSEEENYQVFLWIEQQVFLEMPEHYREFIIHILSNEDNLFWFPKAEARKVFKKLMETGKKDINLRPLYGIYLTKEESDTFEMKERVQKERACLMEKMRKEQKKKEVFNKIVTVNQDSGRMFKEINGFLKYSYWEERKYASSIVAAFVRRRYGKHAFVLPGAEINCLIDLLNTLFKEKEMPLEDVKNIIHNVREVHNDD